MPRLDRSTVGKENRHPFYRRLGWPQGKSGRPPQGFDRRTVQPVASRYTDYAKPAHTVVLNSNIKGTIALHRLTALRLLLLLSILGRCIDVTNPLHMQPTDWQRLSVRKKTKTKVSTSINISKTKRNLFYIRNQSVPRSKHFPLRLYI